MIVRPVPDRATLTVFTPGAIPGETLQQFTVGRNHELAVLTRALHEAATTPARPHVLLVGSRGSGKSHLLSLAAHHIRSGQLPAPVALAWLPEDIYSITSYRDLLAELLSQLTGDLPSPHPTAEHLETELTRRAAADGVTVAIIENLDRLMALIGTDGQHALRAYLHNEQALLLLTSTPSLFAGVTSHSQPFYGAFRTVMLSDLAAEEGRELLLRLARLEGNDELGAFLASETGLARLRAIEHLAGGSPRLWMLLAGCVTVELLDDLVRLFVKLLDELSPFYKARMDDLPPAKGKLVAKLCKTRNGGALTVRELAEATGATQQVTSKLLHELERERFVIGAKMPNTDQRTTYYELREPLLRHWFELKATQGRPLSVIVEILRGWYDSESLRRMLAAADTGTPSEAYARAALIESPQSEPVHRGYASGSINDLLAEARLRADSERDRPAALTIEALVLAHQKRTMSPMELDQRLGRLLLNEQQRTRAMTDAGIAVLASDGEAATVGDVLCAAHVAGDRRHDYLALACGGWAITENRLDRAVEILRSGWESAPDELSDAELRLSFGAELAFALFEAGQQDEGFALGSKVLGERASLLGNDHPDTLTSRGNLANWTGETGDHTTARDLLQTLITDRTRVLGPDHPNTLTTRHNHAWKTLNCHDAIEALRLAWDLGASNGFKSVETLVGSVILRLAEQLLPMLDADDADAIAALLRPLEPFRAAKPAAIGAALATDPLRYAPGILRLIRDDESVSLMAVVLAAMGVTDDPSRVIDTVLEHLGSRDSEMVVARILKAAGAHLRGDGTLLAALPLEERRLAAALTSAKSVD